MLFRSNNIYILDKASGSIKNLDYYLDAALTKELVENKYQYHFAITTDIDADYEFIQWSKDDKRMQVKYSFEDETSVLRQGVFWYNYYNGKILNLEQA